MLLPFALGVILLGLSLTITDFEGVIVYPIAARAATVARRAW